MGLPDIVIEFTKKAVSTIAVGTGGIVGMIVFDAEDYVGAHVYRSADQITSGLTAANKAHIERAFLGQPRAVHVYVVKAENNADYTNALKYFGNKQINYICGDPDITTTLATALASWVIAKRTAGKIKPVAVIPRQSAGSDNEGVVNVDYVGTGNIKEGDTAITKAQFCARVAGILAGLSLTQSATFYKLDEITEIPEEDDDTVYDTAIDAGKLVPYNTGSGIVIARAVNSLTTVSQAKTEDLKKIKIVAIQDRITQDIMDTINNSYIGKYSNSYDNKCLLITAIRGYLTQLENEGYIERDRSTIDINVERQRQYLESTGVDTTDMDEAEIRHYNTGSHVFLSGTVSILDAIEDVEIIINKE